ncbi:uncharacterized protein EMH_0043130 [Eimeria mitis]|uniref:Uncharacterized protein n=1 Tax=Eimeria mitis TaxID=44415 RepID=U6K7L3_9EIME|nr:uncharacterized protein EMH_0043130 [Eimeria mitis]CDJ32197.1 hypothetical protein, conserved [Eimeria mitis]
MLLLLLLDGKAATEYAVTSGAASVLCRVVFSQLEAAAFEGFCVLRNQPAAVFADPAREAAPVGVASEAGLPGKTGVAVPWKEKREFVGEEMSDEQHIQPRRNALDPKSSNPNQRLNCERHQQLTTRQCGARNSDAEKVVEGHICRRNSVTGVHGSGKMAKLLRSLGCRELSTGDAINASHSPALALLQMLLLLQGTLGLAAAAGGCLFAAPALRCFFGPSTVAPGSGFVQTLQVCVP